MAPVHNLRPLRLIPGGASDARREQEHLSDLVLLEAVRAGNAASAALLHDRLRPIVDRTLARLLGGHDPDYDDLAQQALIELVLSIGRFRSECPLDAWASIVVARIVYKHIRRRRIERRLFALERSELPEVPDRSGASGAVMRSVVRRVETHLRALPAVKSWTFILHDVHGYDLDEISSITGVSRSAAQSRLVRGRKALHERIGRDPELAALLQEIALHREGE
ncbi:MAG TPA: RNA polymerase sigma factor [Polyangiaceae bacterium]|nr:RNA polymerase sigma factor [Polyangiaceae bacterium]